MKTFRSIAVTIMTVVLPTMAVAQNAVDNAINDFVKGKNSEKYITARNYEEAQEADSLPTAYYYAYKFSIDKKHKLFEQLHEAFENGQCKYYKKWTKQSGETANEKLIVGYGARSEKSISFGSYKERNYILLYVRDNDNPRWRTCYALVWYDDEENDDVYNGILYKIYSPDPEKMERKKSNRIVIWGDANRRMEEIDEAMKDFKLSMERFNADSLIFDSLTLNGNYLTINGKTIDLNSKNKQINTAEDFLERFSSLRALYLSRRQNTYSEGYRTSIVNKIVSLCKSGASLLSDDEKAACAYGIKEMQKESTTEYDKKLLDIALKALK